MHHHKIARKFPMPGSIAPTLICAFLVTTGLTSTTAFAQVETADDSYAQLQEIVVTAQRRSERLQDIPVAVSAFNAEALQASGVANLADLSHVAPSLQVSSTAGVYLPFLRGVGNNNGSLGNESSVATYIDDVYYTRLATAYLELGSIDRVEVLNGPQGTLFGRNSSGGAIQMFSKDPGRDAEVNATIGYANFDKISGQFYASTPLTDTLAWNITVAGSDQRDGWGKSLTTGEDANLGWFVTLRSKLVWEPTDRTGIKLVGFYAKSRSDIGSVQDFYEGTFGLNVVEGTVLTSLKNDKETFYDTRLDHRPDSSEEGYGGSLRIDQDVGFADIVSISAFRKSDGVYRTDLDYSGQPFYSADLGDQDDQITQEFQVKSKGDSKINWILGAYYLHWKAGYNPAVGYGDLFNLFVAPGAQLNFFSRQIVNSYSGFVQVTAPLGERTNLTVGGRYTHDRISGYGEQNYVIPGVGEVSAAAPGVPNPFSDKTKTNAFTYRVALDHRFTDDVMAYASVSRGFKAGAYNTLPLQTEAADPEKVQAYEIGLKTELLDRRIRLNGAAFWSDITSPQVLTTINTGTVSAVSLTNAEKARIRGAEASIEAIVSKGLTLRGAATYLDAEYTRFTNTPIFSGGLTPGSIITGPVLGDGSGNRMANVPEWRFDLGANYAVTTDIGEWVGDVSMSYTGSYPWTADNNLAAKSVTLVNASLTFTPTSLDWLTVSLWGKNLGNERYYLIGQESAGPAGTGGYPAAPAAPRTYGGSLSVKF
ncbi:TonB-dependent receptor [Sphingosinicella xenopeptidilytica]|uniref:TonB-dependent receptor n=1 Tax=Sphingosinicella xenopeptidilytica TaxID=364098 RepID=A0ABW3C561_SPHXN